VFPRSKPQIAQRHGAEVVRSQFARLRVVRVSVVFLI
jgi:hypothetical protein